MIEQNKWYPFHVFKRALDERLLAIDSADLFCKPANKWLREAWIAGEFAKHVRAKGIYLAPEGGWPDFEIETAEGQYLSYEAVEADRPGRKRGHEWRVSKRLGYPTEHSSYEEMLAERALIPAALTGAVQRKLNKRYPNNVAGLVIYLNIGWGVWRSEIEELIAKHTQDGFAAFSSVWTLWSGRLYRTSESGHLSNETPEPKEAPRTDVRRKSLEELYAD